MIKSFVDEHGASHRDWFLFFLYLFVSNCSQAQYVWQHKNEIAVQDKAPVKADSFDLQDVKLLPGRFKDNSEREAAWLLSLPNERLLHSFRVNAGMPTDKKSSATKMPQPLGGWEALDMELRGHSIAHLLSGLALQYASTGNEAFKKKNDSLVGGLAEVQKVFNEGGYLSAYPQHYIDRNIAGTSVWAPWYTLHKIMAGLIDSYWYADNKQALEVATGMTSWAYKKLSPLPEASLAKMLRNEFGGMNEAWYNLYSITGNAEHLELAQMFYHHAVLDPLEQKEDKLNKLYANTIIPKISGEARAYELTGNEKDKTITTYFWDEIINIPENIIHTLNTNGASVSGWFKPVPGQPLTFTTAAGVAEKQITLKPYYEVHHERYAVYWDLQ